MDELWITTDARVPIHKVLQNKVLHGLVLEDAVASVGKDGYRGTLRSRSAFPMTETLERLMATLATMGERRTPRRG